MGSIEFYPVDDTVKAIYKHIENGTAFKMDLSEQARALTNQMTDLAAMMSDHFEMEEHANRLDAMAQVTMSDFHEYLHEKITRLPEDLALATSWTSDYLGYGLDERDEELAANPPPPIPTTSPYDPGLALACFAAALITNGRQNQADIVQTMLNRVMTIGYGDTLFDIVTARNQYAPISAAMYNAARDDAMAIMKFGQLALSVERIKIACRAANPFDALDMMFGTNKVSDARAVYADFKANGILAQTSAALIAGRTEFARSMEQDSMKNSVTRDPISLRFGNNADQTANTYQTIELKQGANK